MAQGNSLDPSIQPVHDRMLSLKKPILFLKDKTLKSLHTDLVGKLYEEFDFQNYTKAFDGSVIKWLKQHDII